MSLAPDQKLKILDGVCKLYVTFTTLANSDTGLYPFGDDTGRAPSTDAVAATSYRAALTAHSVHSDEGWYRNCNTMLTAMGAP